jgi:hypothetical protein
VADDLPGAAEDFLFFDRFKRRIEVEVRRQSKCFGNVGLDQLLRDNADSHCSSPMNWQKQNYNNREIARDRRHRRDRA